LKLNNQKFYQRLVELGNREDYESLRRMLNLEKLTLTPEEKWKPTLLGTKVSTRRIQRLFRSLYHQAQTGNFPSHPFGIVPSLCFSNRRSRIGPRT
jgi:hypothetical protein